ncbi:hypothetical protein AWB71_05284 [Caballeronia peredens]|nr:hypothetical protein AWB71_05284 [Caballeronia peredens]
MIEIIKAFAGEFSVAGIENLRGMEGHGFECTLVRAGRVIGRATDWGDGGMVNIDVPRVEDRKALLEHATKIYPDIEYERDGLFISILVDYTQVLKKMKTKAKKVVVAVDMASKEKDERGVPMGYSVFNGLANTPENRAKVRKDYPELTVMNEELEKLEFKLPTHRSTKTQA